LLLEYSDNFVGRKGQIVDNSALLRPSCGEPFLGIRIMKNLLALALAIAPVSCFAQDWQGIAFVQAPEQSQGVGLGHTPQEAIDNALAQCVGGGALRDECIVTTYCDYGWSIDIFAQHEAGNHWHENFCGLPDRAIAENVASVICKRDARPYLIECMLVQVYDPEGNAMMEW
jgi:hypothetical protein